QQIVPRQLNFCCANCSSCRCDLRPPRVLKTVLERRAGRVLQQIVPRQLNFCRANCSSCFTGGLLLMSGVALIT
ncbi:unnamed protein product, partial [Effrenium voratum]